MSEAKKALTEAITGTEIDWDSYSEMEDLEPTEGFKKRGRKKLLHDREVANSEFVEDEEDRAIMDSMAQNGLKNAPLPEHRIQQEKTDHRFLVYLFAQGKSVKEVYLQMGGQWDDTTGKPLPTKQNGGKYSYAHLTQIRRQPWFQQQVVEIMAQEGGDIVKSTFQNEFENSVRTIIEVRDDQEEKGSTRLAAANTLLDRMLGKPVAHVESTNTQKTILEMASDGNKLDKELEIIEAEIVALQPAKQQDDK